ncbi:hypothetical protein TNCT_41421 [Trichonephila clavata]|uniref:Uncharacterized protein n=1 Tax=Trichonephila clavata TaxID=2740835 RepID=A0A8X6FZS1_TRICU|nr:hypothetical protein TNCT_41421 [Trichonephila clavata]
MRPILYSCSFTATAPFRNFQRRLFTFDYKLNLFEVCFSEGPNSFNVLLNVRFVLKFSTPAKECRHFLRRNRIRKARIPSLRHVPPFLSECGGWLLFNSFKSWYLSQKLSLERNATNGGISRSHGRQKQKGSHYFHPLIAIHAEDGEESFCWRVVFLLSAIIHSQ